MKPQRIGENIPQVFHVHLEPREAPDDVAQGLESKTVKFAVEQLPLGKLSGQVGATDDGLCAVRNLNSQGPKYLQSTATSSKQVLKEEPHLAIVLKGFNRELALEKGITTEGAIVKITDGVDWYYKVNGDQKRSNRVKKFITYLKWPKPLKGQYACPVMIRTLGRPAQRDPMPDQVKPGMSTKALGKRPHNNVSTSTKVLQIDHAYGLMECFFEGFVSLVGLGGT